MGMQGLVLEGHFSSNSAWRPWSVLEKIILMAQCMGN